jgi:hypothetical protein
MSLFVFVVQRRSSQSSGGGENNGAERMESRRHWTWPCTIKLKKTPSEPPGLRNWSFTKCIFSLSPIPRFKLHGRLIPLPPV